MVALQRLLGVKDHPVPVTGFFDDATEDAARALEQQTNIPPDGIVGRVTWQQLAAPIRRGDSGAAVLAAEELLQLAGVRDHPRRPLHERHPGPRRAVPAAPGLPVDGIVDIDTWRVLLALAFRAQNPPLVAGPATTAATTSSTSVAATTSVGAVDHVSEQLGEQSRRGEEPPRQVDGLGDPDTGRRRATTAGGGVPSSTMRISPSAQRSVPVCEQVEGERLAQLARAVGEVGRRDRGGAPHHVDARERHHGPQQHRLAVAVGAGDDVGAVVHPVA